MAEEGGERKSSRTRRLNANKLREDMYFYDIPENEELRESN